MCLMPFNVLVKIISRARARQTDILHNELTEVICWYAGTIEFNLPSIELPLFHCDAVCLVLHCKGNSGLSRLNFKVSLFC